MFDTGPRVDPPPSDPRSHVPTWRYHARELGRRLSHYVAKRRRGYRDRGSLERAAETILAERAERGFEAGGHFRGVWPRDLCFAARGLVAAGYGSEVAETGDRIIDSLSEVFYTDFHDEYRAATPAEGVDTFPALVLLLSAVDRLEAHADSIIDLAAIYREKFVGPETGLVTGRGSSWWDSAAQPREAYNTVLLLAAVERLEERGIATTFTGESESIRNALVSHLWNGSYFDERRGSSVLACDANVTALYFGLVDDERARSIADSLSTLETPYGLRMRARPFGPTEVHPFFLLHRDYHYHVWPWNSLTYANGIAGYGLEERAQREVNRIERLLAPYGNFLEVCTFEGEPYVKRGYASAEDFTVAAALWTEYDRRFRD
ncbi:glucosidase family protein [Natronobacterium texcoconense]|uniref:Uncharacterized protein n=1 Tax=Natronobacterium texcoconense TaxID=1095778 RepID=A0A1H1ADZ5_NATTX|nr:hypothetical protein [Natronobacterium texcoconense]SDQ37935.1 hypothetical protein SAMN04489842_0662 [Natronobacterium texcoconense]